jgi:aspartyl-tRNA(Asn)/glutamyl-tRNA(Gln) amidotransferase subunit C
MANSGFAYDESPMLPPSSLDSDGSPGTAVSPNAVSPGGAHIVTSADVIHVARLARLALTDDEINQYAIDLAGILTHAQDVASLNTDGVVPTAHPLPLVNVFRPDIVRPGADRAEVLAMAPRSESNRFRVPNILGDAQ